MRLISEKSRKIVYSCPRPLIIASLEGNMAASKEPNSVCESFPTSVSYALRKLGSSYTLKEEQKMAIKAIYEGRDAFVCLPTGFGKSLCYQVLPFLFDHKLELVDTPKRCAVLVVSPLIALMIDQVQSLRSRGIMCSIISSRSSDNIMKEFLANSSSFMSDSLLFCSPEAILQSKWRDIIEKPGVSERIVAVVIDESHCVSKWYAHGSLTN